VQPGWEQPGELKLIIKPVRTGRPRAIILVGRPRPSWTKWQKKEKKCMQGECVANFFSGRKRREGKERNTEAGERTNERGSGMNSQGGAGVRARVGLALRECARGKGTMGGKKNGREVPLEV